MPTTIILAVISNALDQRNVSYDPKKLVDDINYYANAPHSELINVVANILCGYCYDVFQPDQLNLLIENLAGEINRQRLGIEKLFNF